MDSEEFKKVCSALSIIMAAIRRLSEEVPRAGYLPSMSVTQVWITLDEACEELGLPKRKTDVIRKADDGAINRRPQGTIEAHHVSS